MYVHDACLSESKFAFINLEFLEFSIIILLEKGVVIKPQCEDSDFVLLQCVFFNVFLEKVFHKIFHNWLLQRLCFNMDHTFV